MKLKLRANKPNFKRGYILFFRREEILALLPNVFPHLIIKRRKAELLLEYMRTRTRGTAIGAAGRFVGIPLIERQKRIIAEIRKENKRGPPI